MLSNLEIRFEGRELIPKMARCSERLEWVPNIKLKRFLDSSLYVDKNRYFKKRLTVEGSGFGPNLEQIPNDAILEVRTGIRISTELPNRSKRVELKMITNSYQVKIDEKGNINWTWEMEEI